MTSGQSVRQCPLLSLSVYRTTTSPSRPGTLTSSPKASRHRHALKEQNRMDGFKLALAALLGEASSECLCLYILQGPAKNDGPATSSPPASSPEPIYVSHRDEGPSRPGTLTSSPKASHHRNTLKGQNRMDGVKLVLAALLGEANSERLGLYILQGPAKNDCPTALRSRASLVDDPRKSADCWCSFGSSIPSLSIHPALDPRLWLVDSIYGVGDLRDLDAVPATPISSYCHLYQAPTLDMPQLGLVNRFRPHIAHRCRSEPNPHARRRSYLLELGRISWQ
ncbi:hypothetical protein C8R46DRAFT_365636 [Mycena filopes]|nr:hypothetical protein C8R46DRAFT_365636 [Mycena filopes]